METSPARMVIAKKGSPRQIFTRITENIARVGSDNQGRPVLRIPRRTRGHLKTLKRESNIHHQAKTLRAVGITQGRRMAPRKNFLKRTLRFNRRARAVPATVFARTAAEVKRRELSKVWRKISLWKRLKKFLIPTKVKACPMMASLRLSWMALKKGKATRR